MPARKVAPVRKATRSAPERRRASSASSAPATPRSRAPAASPPRDPEGTRERILASAEEAFAAHGLRGARVQEIVARAGVNERMLYHYFGDKEGLYQAVLQRFITSVAADIEQALEAPGSDPVERMADLLRRYFDALATHPQIVRVYLHEVLAGMPTEAKVQKMRQEIDQRLSPRVYGFFADAERDGVFRSGQDWRVAMILAAGFGFLFPLALPRLERLFGADLSDPAELAAIRDSMVDTLLQGVLARRRPRRKGTP